MSPMKHEQRHPSILAQLRRTGADRGVPRFVEDEFPNRTPDWNDPASRRRFLTLMGASSRWPGLGVHGAAEGNDCSLRAPAGRIRSRRAAVLRDGDEHGRYRDGAAGREPSGTADQDRRKSAASGEPGRDRRVHAGERADALRSGPVAVGDAQRVSSTLGRIS